MVRPKSQQFIVEEVLDHRTIDHATEYLLKWQGYDEPTWESLKNMQCDKLLKEYWAKIKRKSKSPALLGNRDTRSDVSTMTSRVVKNKECCGCTCHTCGCCGSSNGGHSSNAEEADPCTSNNIPSTSVTSTSICQNLSKTKRKRHSDDADDIEALVGVLKVGTDLMFLVKHRNKNTLRQMPLYDVHELQPRMVLNYLAARVQAPYIRP